MNRPNKANVASCLRWSPPQSGRGASAAVTDCFTWLVALRSQSRHDESRGYTWTTDQRRASPFVTSVCSPTPSHHCNTCDTPFRIACSCLVPGLSSHAAYGIFKSAMTPTRSVDGGHKYKNFNTGDSAFVIAGDIYRNTIVIQPNARELVELLSKSSVGDVITEAPRAPGNEEEALARVDSFDPVQSSTTPDIEQSWRTNEQAHEQLRECLKMLDPSFTSNTSLHQDFLELESRLRVHVLKVKEQTVLLVQHSPQPNYSLCYGFPKDAIEALKEPKEEGYHHGLFWDVRENLHALHRANDIRFKKPSITIQFLSVHEDVGCWKMLQAWQKQLTKQHKNIKQDFDKRKRTLELDDICVLDKLQNSFCGVHVTLKVIPCQNNSKKQRLTDTKRTDTKRTDTKQTDTKQTDTKQTDTKQKTFSVLCFNHLDREKFEQTRREVRETIF